MSNIRFRTLPSAEFSVSVLQAGIQAGLTTSEPVLPPDPDPDLPPPDTALKVTIQANREDGFATCCMWFEATATGFEANWPEQDLLYVWNFGDPGSKFANLSGRLDMLNKADPTQKKWNDANVGYGPFVAHAYRKPGTYSVTCDVYYSHTKQPVRSNTVSITIADPDTVFGAAETVYASTGTDFTGVPAGAKTITTSVADTAWFAVSGSKRRVLFKRGDKFVCLTAKKDIGTTLVGDWGSASAPRPVFDTTVDGMALRDARQSVIFVMKNIDVKGAFSMETMTGAGDGVTVGNGSGGHYVFDNVKVSGSATTCLTGEKGFEDDIATVCYIDCEVTDWKNYGVYGKWPTVAFLGTWVHANQNGYKQNMASGGGATMRIESFGKLDRSVYPWGGAYFCCTDAFTNYAGRFIGDQPNYKVQGDGVKDSRWVWDRVIAEGSTNTSSGVGSTIADRQNALIDKYIHIGTAQCGYPIVVQQGGTTVRNFYYVLPHVLNEKLNAKDTNKPYMLSYGVEGAGGQTADNSASWFCTYGNTAVIWADWKTQLEYTPPFTMADPDSSGRLATEVVSNYVLHVPFSTGDDQTAEVDTSAGTTGVTFYLGRKQTFENDGKLQTQYATPQTFSFGGYNNQPTLCIPRPTGSNLKAATGPNDRVPFDYIDGTLRGTAPAKGAFKP